MSHRSPIAGFLALAAVYATAGVLAVVPTPWTKVGAAGFDGHPRCDRIRGWLFNGPRLGPFDFSGDGRNLRLRQFAEGGLVLNQHGSWTFPNGVRGAAARL